LADRAVRRQAALWPQSLRDLEAIRRRYEADEESLAHYVRALVSSLPPGERSGYPALDAFGRLSLLEDRYEPDRARQDLRDLAARSSALAPADRAALRAGLRAGPRERSRALLELIRRVAGTGSAQWPALRAHAEALALRAAIDAGRLASEVESAHRRVVDDLLRQRPESQRSDLLGLLAATDWIHSRQRLWSFEMTPREWRAARRDWARYGWADVEALLGDAAPAESGDAVRAALRDAEDHLRDFYETALQRNRAMADNTLAAARRWRADRVVLITGGFHTPGLTDLLRQAGANYAVVCPVFNPRPAPPVHTATLRDQSRLEDLADRQTLAAAQWAIASGEKPVATLGEWRRSWSAALTNPTDRRWIAGLNLISRESGPDGSWTAAVGSASANDARRIQFSGTAGLRSIPLSPPPIPSISDVSAAGRQTVLKMQGGVRRAFATVKRFGRPVLQRSWPWVAAGAVLLGAAWIFLPALFPGNGAEVVFSMGSAQWAAMTGVIFPPWGRHLGVWRLDEHSRGPRDQGNNDWFDELQRLLIALEESDRRLAEAIAAKQKAEISVAQLRLSEARLNLQQFMRRRLAASDEDTATLYLRLEGPKRDLLVRAVGAQVLGRLIHGMTGHFFERARRGLRRRRADLERLLQLEESLPRASAGERERILGDLEKTLVALDRNAQGLIEGLQTFIGTPNVPDIPAPDLAKIKTEARAKLQSLADHRRLDAQWADTLRSALTTGGKTDPLPPLAAHRARHR
ncbi:MAG TPA: hypothetical protein PLN89_04615, partial [Elusimicrobiota bacterium]|nr:hypothetical protein [Elusimicrobiota bacterium]